MVKKYAMVKKYEIWMEGYAATGESSDAQLINHGWDGNPGLIETESFDDAVRKYMSLFSDHGIEENTRDRYISEEAYNNRRSNWNIWACNLFDNEIDARKSFG